MEAPKKKGAKFAMVSEITDLGIKGFPTMYPIIYLADTETLHRYNALMIDAMKYGFDPTLKKLCFTANCHEGITHGDLYNLISTMPEISDEIYGILSNIPAWNPVIESIQVLEKYIELVEIVDTSKDSPSFDDIFGEAIEHSQQARDPKIYQG